MSEVIGKYSWGKRKSLHIKLYVAYTIIVSLWKKTHQKNLSKKYLKAKYPGIIWGQ